MSATYYDKQPSNTEQILTICHSVIDGTFNFTETVIESFPLLDDSINKIEEKTGIPKRCTILGLGLLPLLIFLIPALIDVLMAVYPLLMSAKAIDKEKDVRSRWLIYWLIFHLIHVAELSFSWALYKISKFTLMKCAFLIWCMAPVQLNGCFVSYGLMKPVIMKVVEVADQCVSVVLDQVTCLLSDNEGMIKGVKKEAINSLCN